MAVQIIQGAADGNVLPGVITLKSVILQNAGSDPLLRIYDSISNNTDEKFEAQVDASIQGYMLQIPLWDLLLTTGLRIDIDNGSAFFIYELWDSVSDIDKTKVEGERVHKYSNFTTAIQMTADGQAITGEPGILKGMVIQGSGSDTHVRLWDVASAATHLSTNKRLLDVQIDATYQGFCQPVELFDLEFNDGIYVDVDNGNVTLFYQQ